MLKIAICCGGGFSSSALAAHMEKEVKENHMEERVQFIFIPSVHLADRQDEVDIAMVCPHMEWNVKQEKDRYHIPVTVIPPKLYGLMNARDYIEDAEDLVALWKDGAENIIHFPDEPRPLMVKRDVSHRRWLRGEHADYSKM